MSRVSRQLGESLVNKRLLSRDTLEELLIEESKASVPLAKLLVGAGHVTDADLLEIVAEQLGINYVNLEQMIIQPDALDRLESRADRAQATPREALRAKCTTAQSPRSTRWSSTECHPSGLKCHFNLQMV